MNEPPIDGFEVICLVFIALIIGLVVGGLVMHYGLHCLR
jgi:hypothetical protein